VTPVLPEAVLFSDRPAFGAAPSHFSNDHFFSLDASGCGHIRLLFPFFFATTLARYSIQCNNIGMETNGRNSMDNAAMEAKSIETKSLVALENIADLPVRASLTLHGMNRNLSVLHRAPGHKYVLRLESPRDTQHSRFCDDVSQLLEDLAYFYGSDALPVGKMW
jgi:hypothetical protein